MSTSRTSIPLPPANLRFMNEADDERLLGQGRELARVLTAHGLRANTSVLDIGCGYGRLAIGLLDDGKHTGKYVGFDILRKQIAWCRDELTAYDRRIQFKHINAHNARYNPSGTLNPDEIRFPVGDASIDMASAFSVFTHLYRSTIEHYLDELRRTLRPGAVAVTTWLLWDDARADAVKKEPCSYPMVHTLDEDTIYSDAEDPLRAIAFRQSLVERLVAEHGLRVKSVTRGTWDGVTKSPEFQDVVVIERHAPAAQLVAAQARRALGRAKRKIRSRRK